MLKIGKLVIGLTRNVLIEKIQLSFVPQILPRSNALEAVRNSNPKCLSSIAITKLSYSTKFNSSHYVTKLNKSTDAKNNSSKLLVDRSGQNYSKEEDEKLLEHVNKHGKDSSSLKSFAKEFGRSYDSVRTRIRRLESANEYETNNARREWEFEEDTKLVNYIFKLKSIKSANVNSLKDTSPKDFEEIAIEFKRSSKSVYDHWIQFVIPCLKPHMKQLTSSTNLKKDVLRLIEESHDKTTTLKGYSEADDKYINLQVKKFGYERKTFVKIAKKLGKKHPHVVQLHYDNYLAQTPKVKGPFSQQEDEKILNYINVRGKSDKSFKEITNELGRGSFGSVKSRHDRLVSKNEFEINTIRKNWELDEDQKLIDHIIKLKSIRDGGCDQLEKLKPNDFTDIGKELKRSSASCYTRWMIHIVPTLKTCIMQLPMTSDWKKDLLHHIVKNKIKNKKQLNIEFILKEIAPAQTSQSLLLYINHLKQQTIDGVKKPSKLPLCELASKRLIEKSPRDPIFNEDHINEKKRQEWCKIIFAYYKKLM